MDFVVIIIRFFFPVVYYFITLTVFRCILLPIASVCLPRINFSNNHDDVQAEFDRIQISYNILSEKKTRMQYDRHEVIDDPAAAVQRAVMGAAVSGVVGIGKGIFHIGSSVLDHVIGQEGKIKK